MTPRRVVDELLLAHDRRGDDQQACAAAQVLVAAERDENRALGEFVRHRYRELGRLAEIG
jgi:hypothetical protein